MGLGATARLRVPARITAQVGLAVEPCDDTESPTLRYLLLCLCAHTAGCKLPWCVHVAGPTLSSCQSFAVLTLRRLWRWLLAQHQGRRVAGAAQVQVQVLALMLALALVLALALALVLAMQRAHQGYVSGSAATCGKLEPMQCQRHAGTATQVLLLNSQPSIGQTQHRRAHLRTRLPGTAA